MNSLATLAEGIHLWPKSLSLVNSLDEQLKIATVWIEWKACYETHIVRHTNAETIVNHIIEELYGIGSVRITENSNQEKQDAKHVTENSEFFITFSHLE